MLTKVGNFPVIYAVIKGKKKRKTVSGYDVSKVLGRKFWEKSTFWLNCQDVRWNLHQDQFYVGGHQEY